MMGWRISFNLSLWVESSEQSCGLPWNICQQWVLSYSIIQRLMMPKINLLDGLHHLSECFTLHDERSPRWHAMLVVDVPRVTDHWSIVCDCFLPSIISTAGEIHSTPRINAFTILGGTRTHAIDSELYIWSSWLRIHAFNHVLQGKDREWQLD